MTAERSSDERQRLVALVGLAEAEPDLAEVTPYLSDPSPLVRIAALDLLTEVLPDHAPQALLSGLLDPDPDVRRAAVVGLEETRQFFASQEPPPALDQALLSEDPVVRATVVRLCRQHGWKSLEWYAERLSDPDPGVRKGAVQGLVAKDAVTELAAAAGDQSLEVRRLLAASLGRVRSGGTTRLASALLEDPDPLVRAKTLESLAALGGDESLLSVTIDACGDSSWEVRKGAATALGVLWNEESTLACCSLANDPNLDVRKAAVQSLMQRSEDPEALRALEAALQDPDADVRGYARMGLRSGEDPRPRGQAGQPLDTEGTLKLL